MKTIVSLNISRKTCNQLAKSLLLSLICYSVSLKAFSQDPEYSMFYSNPLYLNPALTSFDCLAYRINTRNAMSYFTGYSFSNYSLSYNQQIDILHGGIGILANHDNYAEGTIKQSSASILYSYLMNLNDKYRLSAGFQVSYRLAGSKGSSFVFPGMIDPLTGQLSGNNAIEDSKNSFFDYSLGLALDFDKAYFGASAHHITTPLLLEYPNILLDRKYTIHGGFNIPLHSPYRNSNLAISPNFIYRKQGNHQQLSTGVYLLNKAFSFGLWLKNDLEFSYVYTTFSIGYIGEFYQIGYSYDILVTNLKIDRTITGAHEISLNYNFDCPKKKKYRAIKCPRF